jgi:hypothetical protein
LLATVFAAGNLSPPGAGISAAHTRSDVRQNHVPVGSVGRAPPVRFPDRVTVREVSGSRERRGADRLRSA